MTLKIKVFSLSFLFLLFSCEENNDNPNESHPVKKEKLTGYVQKGPFINGTSINISELSSNLIQTGKTFSSQISDNKGSFELRQLDLSSQYVELKADGFYYNEITGDNSSARLTLYALSDLTDKSSLNVNILSHLEKSRINYLVSEGASFSDAKKTAQEEILNLFSINKTDMMESELLDISKDGEDNAILLAISVIIQGFRSDADLSELLANISTDIEEDGILNSSSTGTALVNHAQLLNLPKIRQNLINRYEEMGVETTIPDFEKYVQMFLNNTEYEFTSLIEYPEFSNYGENILYPGKTNFNQNTGFSLAANLPHGTRLKVVLRGGLWYYEVLPEGPVNWTVSRYNETEQQQSFTSTESGKDCDLKIEFTIPYTHTDTIYNDSSIYVQPTKPETDTIFIDYYENMSEEPTKTKTIIIQ
ncbi:MAG: hypothetical protein ACOCWA_10425 [Bacteroidota bacterium]